MSIKNFCAGLYRFFTWPFRMIYQCFKREPEDSISPRSGAVTSQREPEAKLSPTIFARRKLVKIKTEELQGKVHFKPLFLPDHFSASSDSKNDAEFKDKREQERRREERIKARREMMKVLKRMEELEKLETEGMPKKPKPKTPSPDFSD